MKFRRAQAPLRAGAFVLLMLCIVKMSGETDSEMPGLSFMKLQPLQPFRNDDEKQKLKRSAWNAIANPKGQALWDLGNQVALSRVPLNLVMNLVSIVLSDICHAFVGIFTLPPANLEIPWEQWTQQQRDLRDTPSYIFEKEWKGLSRTQKEIISSNPGRYLCERWGIYNTMQTFLPLTRFCCIHALPCWMIVGAMVAELDQMSSDWDRILCSVFMPVYSFYFIITSVRFWKYFLGANDEFTLKFCVLPMMSTGGHSPETVWDARNDIKPWKAWGITLVWLCFFAPEVAILHFLDRNFGVERGMLSITGFLDLFRFLMMFPSCMLGQSLSIQPVLGFMSIFFCLTEDDPGFWNYTGALLGGMPLFGIIFAGCLFIREKNHWALRALWNVLA